MRLSSQVDHLMGGGEIFVETMMCLISIKG